MAWTDIVWAPQKCVAVVGLWPEKMGFMLQLEERRGETGSELIPYQLNTRLVLPVSTLFALNVTITESFFF